MSKKTTTTTTTTEEAPVLPSDPRDLANAIDQMAREAFDRNDTDALSVALSGILAAEEANQARTVITTVRNRVVTGTVLTFAARLAREVKAGGKDVTPAEAEKAARASGATEASLSRTTIGLCLRSTACFFGQVDTLTTEARDLFGTPEGPAAWTATDVLVWAEARTGKRTESNRGQRPATKAEAEAKAAERTDAATKAEAEAKARRQLIAATIADGGKLTVVKGLRLTYGQLDALSTDNLAALRQTIDDMLTARDLSAKAAKAEAEAARKATIADAEAEAKAIREAAKAEAEATLAAALAKVKA